MPFTSLAALLLLGLALVSAACGSGGSEGSSSAAPSTPPVAGGGSACPSSDDEPGPNLLLNGGLEQGSGPWFTIVEDAGFEVTSAQPRSGSYSALQSMRDPAEAADAKVYYLVQEITPDTTPQRICGHYRVDHWVRGSAHQYVQFVAIALTPTNLPTEAEGGFSNYQIRYLLAGADSPPFAINNAKFVFVTREDAPIGEWVPFEINLRDDFEELWGAAPEGFEKMRLLFEVRWDNKVAGQSPAEADVYWDDLYAGDG